MGKGNPILRITTKKNATPSEHVEQRDFVCWFKQTYPDVRILAIPNGGYRSITTAARLKAEGASPGVPDLFIPAWFLWVEMKRVKGGVLNDAQKDWINYLLQSKKYHVIVAKGNQDAQQQIAEFLKGQT